MYQDDDATLGQVVTPVDAVGVYVPGGKAVYPSSVLMCAIPAKVAGVSRDRDVSRRHKKAGINPYLLVAADIAGVTEIYRVGGVQAVGGNGLRHEDHSRESIRSLGPAIFMWRRPNGCYTARSGSIWWQVRASCWWSRTTTPSRPMSRRILLCEAEHDEDAQVFLVTTSARLAKDVARLIDGQLKGLQREKIASKSIARHSVAFVVPTMDEAIDGGQRDCGRSI